MHPLTIVTAASSNHYRPLLNFVKSVKLHEPDAKLIVYDLGMTIDQWPHVRQSLSGADALNTFNWIPYPEWMSIKDRRDIGHSAGCYAWKAVILNDVASHDPGLILWCDAGNLITSPLTQIRHELLTKGFYTPTSLHWVSRWTHPKTLELMNADTSPRALARENRNGAVIGFNTAMTGTFALLRDWRRACLTKEIICPEGADITNHRFDQAVLTILAHAWERTHNTKLADVCPEIRVHCDNFTDEQVRKEIGL